MHRALREVLEFADGVVGRRQYPDLTQQVDHARSGRELITVLPGVYAVPEVAADWRTRVRAVSLWDEDAVIVGHAAAALTFAPTLTPAVVVAAGRRTRFHSPGISFTRRRIPAELVVTRGRIRIASPALTALDLTSTFGGDIIDDALRSRQTTLEKMHEAMALTTSRRGNVDRRRVLLDSRGKPWSSGERLAHRHLYAAGITRWDSNVEFTCEGFTYFLDIKMKDCPLVAEIDGKVHQRSDLFESDRRRGNHLLLAGQHVMHFTYLMLCDEPDWFVAMVRRGIDYCS